MARVYESSGGSYTVVSLMRFVCSLLGPWKLTSPRPLALPAILYLVPAPLANYTTTSIVGSGASETHTFAIESDEAFLFPVVYRQNGSTLEQVIPDSFSVDDSTSTATISFTNDGVGAVFDIYWQYGTVSSNTICVAGA